MSKNIDTRFDEILDRTKDYLLSKDENSENALKQVKSIMKIAYPAKELPELKQLIQENLKESFESKDTESFEWIKTVKSIYDDVVRNKICGLSEANITATRESISNSHKNDNDVYSLIYSLVAVIFASERPQILFLTTSS